MNVRTIAALSSLSLVLLACTADTELPPERTVGTISGKVIDGAIANAHVSAYAYGNGTRGRRLGGTITSTDGSYSLEIQAASQLILVESRGGSYTEQATGTVVAIPDGQVIRALVPYQDGEPVETMVTPLTHLVTGLTFYKIRQGTSPTQAYNEARSTIEEFLTIDTVNTVPIDITQADNSVNAVSEEALYGFYLAGISNWSLWTGNQNRVAPHTTYTSMGFAQIMYNDIQSDGVLDGVGYDLDRQNLMPLAVGVVPIDAQSYRAMFSLHLLAVSNISGNTTSLKAGELDQVAQDIATKPTDLFAGTEILDINNQAPEINLPQALQPAYSGTLNLPLNIGGFLDAASVNVSVDGSFVASLENPQNPEINVDTLLYPPDGEHTITVEAEDILGNTASRTIAVTFDNTNPVVNVTTPPVTNMPSATIGGTFSDNLAGVESIVVNGQPAVLDAANNWSALVEINPGDNTIQLSVYDFAGNQLDTQSSLFLDIIAPVIDTSNGHSSALFSNGDGSSYPGQLQNTNASSPLYIETSRLNLNGVPITRTELDNNGIPYFAITVSDERSPGNNTAFEDLQVRVQYEKNGEVLNPWHELPVPGTGNDEYLIPLASETLAALWHQASPLDPHNVLVELRDPAGNVTATTFYFKADFYVPPLDASGLTMTNLGTDIFATTAFDDRASLNNREFASTELATIVNPVNTAIYIRPADNSTHTVDQVVDKLVREHQMRLITSTEWQVRLMPPNQQCPGDNANAWETVSSLYNWVNGDWSLESVPAPVPGPIEYAPDDSLPTDPDATPWSDAPHFDNQFSPGSSSFGNRNLTYSFDYVLDNTAIDATVAYIRDWVITHNNGNELATCPDARFFQQRQTFAYQSEPGFPQPVLSQETFASVADFTTTGFTVFNNDTGMTVDPVNGWYPVPAGHSVTITKHVTTPTITNYTDEISPPDVATYTPRYNDNSISWLVNRSVEVTAIHDAGEPNIPNMSPHMDTIGSGVTTYQISR